jgi:hypothetical protein
MTGESFLHIDTGMLYSPIPLSLVLLEMTGWIGDHV